MPRAFIAPAEKDHAQEQHQEYNRPEGGDDFIPPTQPFMAQWPSQDCPDEFNHFSPHVSPFPG